MSAVAPRTAPIAGRRTSNVARTYWRGKLPIPVGRYRDMRLKNHEPGVNVRNATEPKHLLQPPITLLQRVFGDQFLFVAKHYGTGLTEQPDGGEMLADFLAIHNGDDEQSFRRRRGGWQQVVFSRDAETSREAIKKQVGALRKGFAQLYRWFQPVIAENAFLIRTVRRRWSNGPSRVRFDSDGRFLVLFDMTGVIRVRVYVAENGDLIRYAYRVHGGVSGQNHIIVTHDTQTGKEEQAWGYIDTRTREETVLSTLDGIEREEEESVITRLSDDRRQIQIARQGEGSFATTLFLRVPVTDYILSPTGDVLATLFEECMVLWRIC